MKYLFWLSTLFVPSLAQAIDTPAAAYLCTSMSNSKAWMMVVNFEGVITAENGGISLEAKEAKPGDTLYHVTEFKTLQGKQAQPADNIVFDGKTFEASDGNHSLFYGNCEVYKQ
ncbi:hypothetical protein [Kluyvera sichuanensis]|uniref:Uncharacterized protein n=2 Tax=Kluyvera sichuanensis TaxID=2725494 RepID=A0ABR6RLX3_9ENTR|nr:hypothetical protein [Kluyvera sichuanensis]MBC1184128.1 hypothetical protein [Kluyvera sichuanensis]